MTVLGGVPIKPFRSAKNRLAKDLTIPQRRLLAEHLGQSTLNAVDEAGAEPMVLAADEEVSVWAKRLGYRALLDPGSDLNSAARAAADLASKEDRPWLLIHGDLDTRVPFEQSTLMRSALEAAGRPVEMFVVPGAQHGFTAGEEAISRPVVDGFLNVQLK